MATYYVSAGAAGGGDGSTGNRMTLAEAVAAAVSSDTISLASGTYAALGIVPEPNVTFVGEGTTRATRPVLDGGTGAVFAAPPSSRQLWLTDLIVRSTGTTNAFSHSWPNRWSLVAQGVTLDVANVGRLVEAGLCECDVPDGRNEELIADTAAALVRCVNLGAHGSANGSSGRRSFVDCVIKIPVLHQGGGGVLSIVGCVIDVRGHWYRCGLDVMGESSAGNGTAVVARRCVFVGDGSEPVVHNHFGVAASNPSHVDVRDCWHYNFSAARGTDAEDPIGTVDSQALAESPFEDVDNGDFRLNAYGKSVLGFGWTPPGLAQPLHVNAGIDQPAGGGPLNRFRSARVRTGGSR